MALTAPSTKYFRRRGKMCIRQIADNPPSEWISSKFTVKLEKNPWTVEFRNGMVKWNFSRTLQVENKSKLFTEQKILWLSLFNEIVWWWVEGRGKNNSLLPGPWDLLWNSLWLWEEGYENLFRLCLYRRYMCVLHCCVKSKHISAGWIIEIIF